MADPRNVVAVKDWVRMHRPDCIQTLETCGDAIWSVLLIGFEAGRAFQAANPELPLDDPSIYL